MKRRATAVLLARAGALALAVGMTAAMAGCATTTTGGAETAAVSDAASDATKQARFEQDRKSIIAMAGDFDVDFDFTETVAFAPGYKLKPSQLSGGHEVVRVIEDTGRFISLQHILVVEGGGMKMPIKHWRQDWEYEPASVLVFIGGNAWETRAVPEAERAGKWSQTVYQVEDSPRYGAVGAWTYDNGVSEWTGKAEWRPLPRRDATKRDDYHAILAINRHALTPEGWVHEQENSKLALTNGKPELLVREVGVNIYRRYDKFDASIATNYLAATEPFWKGVRADWDRLEREGKVFGLTVQGEPEPLYAPLLELADEVQAGTKTTEAALAEAKQVIAKFTTRDIGTLADRVAKKS